MQSEYFLESATISPMEINPFQGHTIALLYLLPSDLHLAISNTALHLVIPRLHPHSNLTENGQSPSRSPHGSALHRSQPSTFVRSPCRRAGYNFGTTKIRILLHRSTLQGCQWWVPDHELCWLELTRLEDFMLCKSENRDPEHCLKEGRKVTRCAAEMFVQSCTTFMISS
jgi:hypothetical protein